MNTAETDRSCSFTFWVKATFRQSHETRSLHQDLRKRKGELEEFRRMLGKPGDCFCNQYGKSCSRMQKRGRRFTFIQKSEAAAPVSLCAFMSPGVNVNNSPTLPCEWVALDVKPMLLLVLRRVGRRIVCGVHCCRCYSVARGGLRSTREAPCPHAPMPP